MKALNFLLCEYIHAKGLYFLLEVVRLKWKFVLHLHNVFCFESGGMRDKIEQTYIEK